MKPRIGLVAIPLGTIALAAMTFVAMASTTPAVLDRAPQIAAERGDRIVVAESKKKAKKQQQNQRQSAPPSGGRDERGS